MTIIDQVQDAITIGDLSFRQIAEKFNMPMADVELIFDEMMANMEAYYQNDSMDGDFDSAMASAGFGTDEDYGYYSEDY